MLTIGSAPDPDAMHLTQGVVRVEGDLFGFSIYSMHIPTFYLDVCPRCTSILYYFTHTFIAYTQITRIRVCSYRESTIKRSM